jgi:hypothetical protein
MAIVTRYFSTAGAGTADGTSWANRAALFSGGAWSTAITGFNFTGTDSLECRIGPGAYTITVSLASGLFANAPTAANPLTFQGCDSSGARLAPPDPDWTSAEPAFTDTAFPALSATTNINVLALANLMARMLKVSITTTGASVAMMNLTAIDWCTIYSSSNNVSSNGINNCSSISNTSLKMLGSNYSGGIAASNSNLRIQNVRVEGNPTAGAGSGINIFASTTSIAALSQVTSFRNPAHGISEGGSAGGLQLMLHRCVVANNVGSGINFGAFTHFSTCNRSVVTGNGAYGINAQSAAMRALLTGNRLRGNTSGDIAGLGNYPPDLENDTSSGTDAAEYVNAVGGDFRIKAGSAFWGKGLGVADEPATSGGGERTHVFGF